MKVGLVLSIVMILYICCSAWASTSDFIHRNGVKLVIADRDIVLRGVCFGNEVWGNPPTPPVNHHDEGDFKRLKGMNVNAVRFYLNYGLFENDNKPYSYKESGFAWLDKNVAWAKKHGIYLILNMHVPQGGFQSNGDGMGLWNDRENQLRLISLWKAIALRYRNEPVIAGYDLLNEPVTPKNAMQWEALAKELVAGIRGSDPNHLLIVERTNGVKAIGESWSGLNLFLVDDPNVMYTFHFYLPFEYSHQNASWTGQGDGGKYPDPDVVTFPSDSTWFGASRNRSLPRGDSDWTYYQGSKFKVTNAGAVSGKPALVSAWNQGTAYFDDMVIEEFDSEGKFLKTLFKISPTSATGWYAWTRNGRGSFGVATVGHGDNFSLSISGTTEDANYGGNQYKFKVTKGHSYAISGWMKGKGITSDECYMRFDFESSPSGGQAVSRNKAYLESNIVRYLEWGKRNNVPMYVGEWGLYKDCFTGDKGGLNWVADMLDIFMAYGVSFTYHAYHEDAFGIYRTNGLPKETSANKGIIDLFTRKLGK